MGSIVRSPENRQFDAEMQAGWANPRDSTQMPQHQEVGAALEV